MTKINVRLASQLTEITLEKSDIPDCFEITVGNECFVFPENTPMVLVAIELESYLQNTNNLKEVS